MEQPKQIDSIQKSEEEEEKYAIPEDENEDNQDLNDERGSLGSGNE